MVGAITRPGVGVKTNLKPTITPYVIPCMMIMMLVDHAMMLDEQARMAP
jgi:hypothetical protein